MNKIEILVKVFSVKKVDCIWFCHFYGRKRAGGGGGTKDKRWCASQVVGKGSDVGAHIIWRAGLPVLRFSFLFFSCTSPPSVFAHFHLHIFNRQIILLLYNQFVIDIINVRYLIMGFVSVGNSFSLVIDLAFLCVLCDKQ